MKELINFIKEIYQVTAPTVVLLGGLWWLFKVRQDTSSNANEIKQITDELKSINSMMDYNNKAILGLNKDTSYLKEEIKEIKNEVKEINEKIENNFNKLNSLIIGQSKSKEAGTYKPVTRKSGKKSI